MSVSNCVNVAKAEARKQRHWITRPFSRANLQLPVLLLQCPLTLSADNLFQGLEAGRITKTPQGLEERWTCEPSKTKTSGTCSKNISIASCGCVTSLSLHNPVNHVRGGFAIFFFAQLQLSSDLAVDLEAWTTYPRRVILVGDYPTCLVPIRR